MKTKKELLEEANKEFPEFYESRRQHNPDCFFKEGQSFPEVKKITVLYYKLEDENGTGRTISSQDEIYEEEITSFDEMSSFAATKIEGVIELSTRKGKVYVVEFICYSDAVDAHCFVVGKHPRNISHFAKEFMAYFIYEFLSINKININKWNNWDLIRPK